MDCNAYRIFISGYIDGELADDEMHMLKGHLQTCEACLSYLHRLEHIEIALKRYNLLQEFPGIPPDFAQNVSRKLQTVLAREKQAVGSELQRTFRERVAAMTEKWGNRLSIRPINWATVVSVLLVGIAGAIGFNVFRTMYSEQVLLSEQVA